MVAIPSQTIYSFNHNWWSRGWLGKMSLMTTSDQSGQEPHNQHLGKQTPHLWWKQTWERKGKNLEEKLKRSTLPTYLCEAAFINCTKPFLHLWLFHPTKIFSTKFPLKCFTTWNFKMWITWRNFQLFICHSLVVCFTSNIRNTIHLLQLQSAQVLHPSELTTRLTRVTQEFPHNSKSVIMRFLPWKSISLNYSSDTALP